jgi:hypothetical protein
MHRAQRPPGEDPAQDRREGDNHPKRDQRILQQMRQGGVTLVLRAQLLEGRVALGEEGVVGMAAGLRTSTPRREGG